MKIVSLVPSLTELLFSLGAGEQVVGVTRYCIHPKRALQSASDIGGTKNPKIEEIVRLNPDLIIANKEENREEDIRLLQAQGIEVMVTEIRTIEESLNAILDIGNAIGKYLEAAELTQQTISHLHDIPEFEPRRAAYLIWKKPWMSVGADTFIADVLRTLHLDNVFDGSSRYPEFLPENLPALNPEIILFSSEPYSFSEKHFGDFETLLPNTVLELVDGEWFSWYGSRFTAALPKLIEWRKKLEFKLHNTRH